MLAFNPISCILNIEPNTGDKNGLHNERNRRRATQPNQRWKKLYQ